MRPLPAGLVVLLLAVGACSDEEPEIIDGFPSSVSDDDIGDPPEWVRVAGPDRDDEYYAREADLHESEAGVYDREGTLVGTFGGCPGGGGGFVELGEDPPSCDDRPVEERQSDGAE